MRTTNYSRTKSSRKHHDEDALLSPMRPLDYELETLALDLNRFRPNFDFLSVRVRDRNMDITRPSGMREISTKDLSHHPLDYRQCSSFCDRGSNKTSRLE